MQFVFNKDPYERGICLRNKECFEIKTGLTILVGCNGAGKTTLLRAINAYCEKHDIPCLFLNNLNTARRYGSLSAQGDLIFLATRFSSSEGERTMINVHDWARDIGNFLVTNKDKRDVFILMDSLGSGFSIDGMVQVKEQLFSQILEYNTGAMNVYLLLAANEYEFVEGENCFDVQECEYLKFFTYNEFKDFVLKSREKRDKIGG